MKRDGSTVCPSRGQWLHYSMLTASSFLIHWRWPCFVTLVLSRRWSLQWNNIQKLWRTLSGIMGDKSSRHVDSDAHSAEEFARFFDTRSTTSEQRPWTRHCTTYRSLPHIRWTCGHLSQLMKSASWYCLLVTRHVSLIQCRHGWWSSLAVNCHRSSRGSSTRLWRLVVFRPNSSTPLSSHCSRRTV